MGDENARSGKTALVLGGGIGGIVVANELRRQLASKHRVIVFERTQQHVFAPSLLWLLIGDRQLDFIRTPLSRLLHAGIEVVYAGVDRIDAQQREVSAAGIAYRGDALVVALGAELAPQRVPGLQAAGYNLYTAEGALALRDVLRSFRKGRIVVLTATPAYKCPAAPYEAAMLIEYECRRNRCRNDVTIDLYAAEPAPMGVAGPAVSAGVQALLQDKSIGYHPGLQVIEVDREARRILFADGSSAEYDLLAYVPPHRAPDVVVDAGLTGEGGWVSVDRHTLETSHPGVYAIGDVTSIPLTMGKPLPKAGVFAHRQAEVVAHNIAQAWNGRGSALNFDGHGLCFVEIGDGQAGIGSGNFYAEPVPAVKLRRPSRYRHLLKVLFERIWLRRFPMTWFIRR
ncbi:MAG: NAD(P)/FAD-dependent oxidoreductase [Vulcanimicrobiaceae bacterium]